MSTAAVSIRPYIGLRYFEERDAHLFYGRDEHVAELLGKVAQNRFVAVMGSSGCGKSSLVHAGLLPEMRSGMIPKAGPRWKVVEFRPGRAPLKELARAINSALRVELAQQLVEEGPLGIARAVAEAKLDEGTNVLVIADQFEEIFRFQREESSRGRGEEAAEQCHALTRRLLDAAAQPELPIHVLLVMRSDYLGECAQFPDLPERMSGSLYLVPRLRRDQLQEAIMAPVGGAIELAVVQRLLGEVGTDPDQLPRLQHLLGRMWDRARGGQLTMEHYTQAGGWVKGLEQHLEDVYTGLGLSREPVCVRMFQQLSELDKGRAVRRRADTEELIQVCGNEVVDVVDKFRAQGFVTQQKNPVDITHECILREWPRSREWLDRENRSARRLRELAEAANDAGWRPGLTPKEEEPIRPLAGLTLQNLTEWRDHTQPTSAWASRYLTDVNFETADGYLRWSEARELAQKKRARLRNRILAALLGLLLFALAFATWEFYRQKDAAEKNARESKARELAAFSTESLSDDPEKGVLLGMQAVNATLHFAQPPLPAAEEALHQAIFSSRVRNTLKGHTSWVFSVAWSPDGRRLATASADKTAKVWNAASGQELLTLKGHISWVNSVAWSPDGRRLATASGDHTVRVWDAASGQELLTLKGPTESVFSVAWSPDGRRLATAGEDHTVRVWDAASGWELLTLKGHTESVVSVAWSPDGRRLATASGDKTAKVWDAGSGQELLTLKGHTDHENSVVWSPDGRRLATASEDHTVQIYAMDIRELLDLARSRVTRNLDADECKRYFQSVTCPPMP
jgi:sugar lactone lactonase YvrE